jgi:sterol desaturase/sphingolipid hydroxylase (fatty acid hydroxylase superfamily)
MKDYIVLAIPVFFALIALEWLAARLLARDVYRLADSLGDLGCGILDQLLGLFMKTAVFAGYLGLFRHRLFELPGDSAWTWLACFVGVDLLYYWFHRKSHEVAFLWAAHAVHHQSEEYNLTVALRQGAIQGWFSWVFYLPLALLGFPPLVFLACSSANTLYQFWIHTRLIGRLGPVEWLFNTPSHHRVHHGRNPEYIDRNHAGVFIVWDKLFGTFAAEGDEPVYGITTPLRSWNPVWANLSHWAALLLEARRTSRWADRLRLFWKPPGWRPAELGGYLPAPAVDRASYRKFDTPAPASLQGYAALHFVLILGASSGLLFRQQHLPPPPLVGGALLCTVGLVAIAGLLERKPWALALEALRLGLLCGLVVALGLGLVVGALALLALGLAFAAGPWRERSRLEGTLPAGG